jgi:hypothetical protein
VPRTDPSRGIFISYRRDDTSGFAGRLYDRLAARYGADRVFMDIDTIRPSSDFTVEIERALSSSAACVLLIGRHWASVTKPDGTRRLDDPTDFVRLELGAALRRGIAVFPVLVDGATMPSSDLLPEDIRALGDRQAIELSNERWNYDAGRLILALDEVAQEGRSRAGGGSRSKLPIIAIAVLVAVVVAGVGAWLVSRGPADPPCSPPEAPEPSGQELEGMFTVHLVLQCIEGTTAKDVLWGQRDPHEGSDWADQRWELSTGTPTWDVAEGFNVVLEPEALDFTPDGDGGFTFDSPKPFEADDGCSDEASERRLHITPQDDGHAFEGWLRISYHCTDDFQAIFSVSGSQ